MRSTKKYYYTMFKTRWGFFGICSTENGIFRTCLPVKTKAVCKKVLAKGLEKIVLKKAMFSLLQKVITDYYKRGYVDFSKASLDLSGCTPVTREVLQACMNIKYGHTISYKELSRLVGHPNSARAVGGIMARNPIPLIIPCHRVLGSDGSLHGFSAPGGLETKKKMLHLEKKQV
jgi:methylated-DNA-[protein]-cysteine S-methyltransferase